MNGEDFFLYSGRGILSSGLCICRIWLQQSGWPSFPFPVTALILPCYQKTNLWYTQELKQCFSLFTLTMSKCQMTRHHQSELYRRSKWNPLVHLEQKQQAVRESKLSSKIKSALFRSNQISALVPNAVQHSPFVAALLSQRASWELSINAVILASSIVSTTTCSANSCNYFYTESMVVKCQDKIKNQGEIAKTNSNKP